MSKVTEKDIKEIESISNQIPHALHKVFLDYKISNCYVATIRSIILLGKLVKMSEKTQRELFDLMLKDYYEDQNEKPS